MLSKIGGFIFGSAIGAGFVCTMDDVIYGQLRRNIILPARKTLDPQNTQNADEIISLSEGTANFVAQFKPHALGRTNVKALLMKDQEYSTPQDHYFGYLNKRRSTNSEQEQKKQKDIMNSMGLEYIVSPQYDINSGQILTKGEKEFMDGLQGQNLNEDEMDIFDLARLRGQKIKDLREITSDSTQENHSQNLLTTGQKHSKKDYQRLKNLDLAEIVLKAQDAPIQKKFEDDEIMKGMVKIERKKQLDKKKLSKKEQAKRDREIQKILSNPQDINYDKAMQLYEEQQLEAKSVTQRDKKKLMRLKKKAQEEGINEKEIENKTTDSDQQKEEEKQPIEQATSIKLDEAIGVSEDSEDIDIILK